MSNRALGLLALVLGLLVIGAVGLGLQRLGYLTDAEPVDFVFTNPTLQVKRGQRVIVRPMLEGGSWRRFTFLVMLAEPQPDDPVYSAPHIRAGVEERGEDGNWYRLRSVDQFVQPLALSQMGATTIKEWLEEIRPVREIGNDGTMRTVLRVMFGNVAGGQVIYVFDPNRPIPAFGWIRQEVHGAEEGKDPEVHFTRPDGFAPVSD